MSDPDEILNILADELYQIQVSLANIVDLIDDVLPEIEEAIEDE